MLTEEEKIRILEEEKFRHIIKDELTNHSLNKKSKIIHFFNTNLGLFILSTILIGGITFLYGKYADRKTELKEMKRLENELLHRFQTLQTLNDTLFWYQTADVFLAFNGNAYSSSLKPEYYNFKSVYQEYSHWSVLRVAENILEIKDNEQLSKIVQHLKKNQDKVNHLRENWFLRLSSGKCLPKNIDVKTKTKVVNHSRVQYNYYLVNGQEVLVKENRNQITKLAKLEDDSDLNSLINLIVTFKN